MGKTIHISSPEAHAAVGLTESVPIPEELDKLNQFGIETSFVSPDEWDKEARRLRRKLPAYRGK